MAKTKKVKHQNASRRHSKNVASSTSQSDSRSDQPQWSEWTLHGSGVYYYRARYLSSEAASKIAANARSSIVPDSYGHYIHYEFWGINDTTHSTQDRSVPCGTAQGQEAAESVEASLDDEAFSAPEPSVPLPTVEGEEIDDTESSSEGHAEEVADEGDPVYPEAAAQFDGHHTIPIIDEYEAAAGMPTSTRHRSGKHSLSLDKKTRKRLQQEKNARINPKAKVYTWLRS